MHGYKKDFVVKAEQRIDWQALSNNKKNIFWNWKRQDIKVKLYIILRVAFKQAISLTYIYSDERSHDTIFVNSSFSLILKFEVYVDYLENKPLPLGSFILTSEALKTFYIPLEELLITFTMALASKSNHKGCHIEAKLFLCSFNMRIACKQNRRTSSLNTLTFDVFVSDVRNMRRCSSIVTVAWVLYILCINLISFSVSISRW